MTQAKRLLEILQDGGFHTVPELIRKVYGLNKPSSARLAARIYDLRKEGHEIESNPLEGGTIWWYRLIPKTIWKKKKS